MAKISKNIAFCDGTTKKEAISFRKKKWGKKTTYPSFIKTPEDKLY